MYLINLAFLIILMFSQITKAQGVPPVRVTNSPTIFNTERVQTSIKGSQLSATNPSLTITVPSNQWCEVILGFAGQHGVGGLRAIYGQLTYGGVVAHWFGGLTSSTSPFEFIFTSPPIKLDTGTYTFDKAGVCAASTCGLTYHGFCYSK